MGAAVTAVLDDPELGEVEVFDAPPERRSFAPADVLRFVVGIGLIVVGAIIAEVAQATVAGLEDDLLDAFGRLPDTFESVALGVAQIATSLVPLVALVVLLVRRRWKVALLLFVAGFAANLAMSLFDVVVVDRGLQDVLDRMQASDSVADATYPSSHVLAMVTAQVTVAAVYISRRWRQVLWAGVGVLALLRLMAVAYPAFDLVLSLGAGFAVGSLVLLVFGTPTLEPLPAELVEALRRLGIRPRRVERPHQHGGGHHYRAIEADGTAYDVTVRTEDERDADLLSRAYRTLRFQPSEVDVRYGSVQRQVEHEALALTLAERDGVRVPHVVRIGTTERGSAVLVTEAIGGRDLDPDDLRSPELVEALWHQLGELHAAGIAHRHVDLEAVAVDADGRPWLTTFDEAQIAAPQRELARDVAELLVETALVVGPGPAVDAAVAGLGPDAVAPALRMLQPLALPPESRRRAKAEPRLLDDLRDVVRDRTGAPDLELARLERLRPRTVFIVVASSVAFYTLLPQLANLSQTADAFADASLAWIGALLVASAATYGFAAVSFSGAVPDPVPFVPNLRAQLAASFAGLVGPAGAGGFALTGRFLQRVGVGGPEAAASVGVNAAAGFAAHLVLLVGFVVWAGRSGVDGFSLPDSTTLLLALAVVLALVGVLLAIRPVRHRVLAPALGSVRSGLRQIGSVFRRPDRVVALFGGSAGVSLAYVVAMACAIEAFGGGLSFAQVGAGYLAGMAIASLAPTPGGLGAVEAALIAAFTGFGLSDGVAVSSVLTFRLATFWLPILPGWFATHWMQAHDEL